MRVLARHEATGFGYAGALSPIHVTPVRSDSELAAVKALFTEYQADVGCDVCFEGFSAEVASLPGPYAPPSGRLLLAFAGEVAAGCVALRDLEDGRCEMKRLYVRPAYRGMKIGEALVAAVVAEAEGLGYREMLLDTLPSMRRAQALYERLGFRDAPPHRTLPVAGARYMAFDLARRR